MHRIALAVLAGIVAIMFATAWVSAGPPAPAATAMATCADGGGVVWNLRSSWGAPYTSQGVRRVRTYGTEFTTSAPITSAHYAIRMYDGSGRLVQTLQGRRSFDFDYKGVAWLRLHTLNPRARPGKARIIVTVGRAGVPGCLVAFRQPALAAALPVVVPAPTPPAPVTPSGVVPPTPTPTPPAPVVPPSLVPPVAPPAPAPADLQIAAVGDIQPASASSNSAATAAAAANADFILGLGDYQYQTGSLSDYNAYFDKDWGPLVPKIYPVLAPTHDQNWGGDPLKYWNGGGASGYQAPVTLSTHQSYSFDKGAWHFIAIDDSCYRETLICSTSALLAWVKADLAAHPSKCTLAYWHQAYFTSTADHAPFQEMQPVVQALYDSGVDVVLQAHNHNYERFAPQTPQRVADPAKGIRAFVVGTGGIGFYSFRDTAANSEARSDSSYGVLRMTLRDGSYDWQFQNTGGTPFTDAGTDTCH
jgi:alkaline phosphatase